MLASSRSAGKKIEFKGKEYIVEELTKKSFNRVDIALFSAGASRSKEFGPAAVEAGAVVIDNSGSSAGYSRNKSADNQGESRHNRQSKLLNYYRYCAGLASA